VGFNLDGYVLRPARVASGNSPDTNEATTGVDRSQMDGAEMATLGYTVAPTGGRFTTAVEPYGDMYRAAVLQKPESREAEETYCVFAATTGSLSTVESEFLAQSASSDAVTVVPGTLAVEGGVWNDGTDTFLVLDPGGRDISSVSSLVIIKGPIVPGAPPTYVTITDGGSPGFLSQDPSIGKVVLDSTALDPAYLNGGFSKERGDQILLVTYILGGPTFWWTRNDQDVTRFGWDGKNQRWSPLQGSLPRDLGAVNGEDEFKLTPPLTRFAVGDMLPYDDTTTDSYALVRSGLYPDSISTPLTILVVTDEEAASGTWSGSWIDPATGTAADAVVGVYSGDLLLNPTYIEANAGRTLWYNPETFVVDADGDLGEVADFYPLALVPTSIGFPALSPVPGPTDRPFLRIGSRRYLTPYAVDTDADLPTPADFPAGNFYWSRMTGRIVLSKHDIDRCTPGASTTNPTPDFSDYDIFYLGARLYYDGVSLNTQPLPVKAPTPVFDEAGLPLDGDPETVPIFGKLYIPRAVPLPPPGISGVLWVPDGSGDTPSIDEKTIPLTRPNGCGMMREIEGIGDTFFFGESYAYEKTDVEEYDEDLPVLKFKVPKNTVAVSRLQDPDMTGSPLEEYSRLQMRRRLVKGEALYFLQAQITPSVYADEARIFSRFGEPFTLLGTETLTFNVDDFAGGYKWVATTLGAGEFSAAEVAADIQATSGVPAGSVGSLRGRIFIRDADLKIGKVEIGWDQSDATDLSGPAALGFLPGWRVSLPLPAAPAPNFCWLPDNGAAMGVFRSPVNMDRRDDTPDIRAKSQFDDLLLTDNITGMPFFSINQPPLEDMPGYDEGVHFRMAIGLLTVDLKNYHTTLGVGIKYDWVFDRLVWTEEGETSATQVAFPTSTLQLDHPAILPETVSALAMDDTAFGLRVKGPLDDSYATKIRGEDFLMPGGGQPGQALLVSVEGGVKASGGCGQFTAGTTTFEDPNVPDQDDLAAEVLVGYLLHVLTGEAEGVYQITKVTSGPPTVLNVFPAFPSSQTTAQWRVYEAKPRDEIDNTLVADVQQQVMNHLPSEPFKIRLLTSTGTVGGSLVAEVADAISSNRVISLRFGLGEGGNANEATPAYLVRGVKMGTVVATGLEIPDTSDLHFQTSLAGGTAYFSFRVGAAEFTSGVNLVMVAVAGTPAAGTVEIVAGSGEVVFADDVVSDLSGSTVFYDQQFLNPDDLTAGECEINASDGSINISTSDAGTYAGETAYFVEEMVTVNDLDVKTSPVSGSILFKKPLRAMQIVETNYFQADTNGDKATDTDGNYIEVTEFLPLIVKLEVATRIDDYTFSFNPTGRTYSEVVDPFMWVGVELQNFAGIETAFIEVDEDLGIYLIKLTSAVESTDEVKINYGVLEAFGGESAYTVSTPPVYRKPFFLLEGQTSFDLETDRSADFPVGHLLMLGPQPLYIKTVAYDITTDLTTVTITPDPLGELGSRAVGRDSGLTVSDFPVSVTLSPTDTEGFMPTLDTSTATGTPLLAVDRGQLEVVFYGDVRQYTKPNHLLEIEECPYIIINSSMSDDGRNTIVEIATPAYKAHDNSNTVRISMRPVYQPSPMEFAGIAPFVTSEEYNLFLMGATESGVGVPGKELIEGTHYTTDAATGEIIFQTPTQPPLNPGEWLHFRYTRQVVVNPLVKDDALLYPLYKGSYLYMTVPSVPNRLLGSVLRAKYTYRNPDSFYFSTLPMRNYLGDVAKVSAAKGGSAPSGGPVLAFPGESNMGSQGAMGLRGEAQDYRDQDRGGRVYVEFFNGVIVAFEQVLEAMDGRIIGDRDGKFLFFLGRDKRYPPPGYEDSISGELNPRLIWREVIENWSPSDYTDNDGWYMEADPVFDPTTAEIPDTGERPGAPDGITPDPHSLSFYTGRQRHRVKNDMDDRLLIGFGRPRGLAFLFPKFDVPGKFKDMWQDHEYSRLFPEKTTHFTRLFPGLEAVMGATGFTDPGYYSSGRKIEVPGPEPGETTEQKVKTRKTVNGVICNPALGDIQNISDVTAEDRHPRARVWAYYPLGSAELDAALGTTTASPPSATFVATPVPLSEFPINPDTGFPDITQLLSQGGGISDLESGDAALSTPAFVGSTTAGEAPRINFGKPDGTIYSLTADSDLNGVYIGEVQAGCVLVLVDVTGAPLAGSSVFVNETIPLEDVISADGGYGDTVFCGPTSGTLDPTSVPTQPTLDETAEATQGLPDYRIQFDLKVGRRSGTFIDASLPTADDAFPFPLQKWFGQNPPSPLSCVEGVVEFVNTSTQPLQLPCLLGEDKDDSGDYQIPYMRTTNTELVVLGEVAASLVLLFIDTSAALPLPAGVPAIEQQDLSLAVYPNEIVVNNGTIVQATDYPGYALNPATLYVGAAAADGDLRPVETAGAYTANSGIGDVRRFDLILSQADQALVGAGSIPAGMTGILTVGDVEQTAPSTDPNRPSTLETPRFVTPTATGMEHKYTIRGFAANVADDTGDNGFHITEVSGGGQRDTVFHFGTVPLIRLTELAALIPGTPPAAGVGNALVIRIYDADPSLAPATDPFIGALVIPWDDPGEVMYAWNEAAAATTAITTDPAGVGVVFTADTVSIQCVVAQPSIMVALGLVVSTHYDFTLDFDTYFDPDTVAFTSGVLVGGAGLGSLTCEVGRDRLTFKEALAFNLAKPRGYSPANDPGNTNHGHELGVQIAVHEVTCQGVQGFTVNSPAAINGAPAPGAAGFGTHYLTLLERMGPSPDASVSALVEYTGTWDGSDGSLRLMAWEGYENTPLAADVSTIKFAGVPSSNANETAEIAAGFGVMADKGFIDTTMGLDLDGNRDYIYGAALFFPLVPDVEAGDIVVVDAGTTSSEAVKAGTYLVRHAVSYDAGDAYATPAASIPFVQAPLRPARQWDDATAPVPKAEAKLAGTPSGSGGFDCVNVDFPTILEVDSVTNEVTLQGVVPVPGTPNGHGWADPATVPNNRHVHLILGDKYAEYDSATSAWHIKQVTVRLEYDSLGAYDPDAGTLVLNMSPGATPYWTDNLNTKEGQPTTDVDWYTLAVSGTRVSGINYLPMQQMGTHLPANNVVGPNEVDDGFGLGISLIAGFRNVLVGNRNPDIIDAYISDVGDDVFKDFNTPITGNLQNTVLGAVDPNSLGVGIPLPKDNTDFYPVRGEAVYGRIYDNTGAGTQQTEMSGVATYLDLSQWASLLVDDAWSLIHFGDTDTHGIVFYDSTNTLMGTIPLPQPPIVPCLLPGDRIVFGDDIDPATAAPGFFALAGIFLEPSFPLPTANLHLTAPRVVAASYGALTTADVGTRNVHDYTPTGSPNLDNEGVHYFVRRVRRWHDAQNEIISGLDPLRFAYEIRRGVTASYSTASTSRTFVADLATYGAATNLGAFTNEDVNIHAGDMLRVFDSTTGLLLDTAEIESVEGTATLRLKRPGLTETIVGGEPFEIYLNQPIIPHEQSNEQLMDLVTDSVVFRRTVDYAAAETEGGKVVATGELSDTTTGPGAITTWAEEGVEEGDYVIIDPAGVLYEDTERGGRPLGDQSVTGRAIHIAGGPTKLDDNRGFYKVTAVDKDSSGASLPGTLAVDGESRFSDGSIFGEDPTTEGYVVLPLITQSDLTGGAEGQQDLRPTAEPVPVGGSYLDRVTPDDFKSIEPFGYEIIRPNNIFSEDALELVLFMRERMFSWMEEIVISRSQSGDYFVFQRDDHIIDVGSATDPLAGLGLISNIVAESLAGLTATTPFANVSDCLSVLDRRFWILDFRLDALGYTQFVDDTWGQRPVLPDLIDGVLNLDDRFRDQRYSWVSFRANREDGSIQTARRAENRLPGRLQKQREALLRKKALDES